jgi:O-antigen ligase
VFAEAPRARPDFVQRYLFGLCVALAVAVPLCLLLGARGLAPVIGIAGLLCVPWARPTRKDRSGLLILAALVLWAMISATWSPAPNLQTPHTAKALSRFTWLHLAIQLVYGAALVTGLARLDKAGAKNALMTIAFGLLVVLLVLIEEGLTGAKHYQALLTLAHQPFRPDRVVSNLAQGGYVVAVIAWPLGVALCRQGRPLLALALAAFVPLSMVLLRGVAPTVALVVSLPIFFLVLRRGRLTIRILAAFTAACTLSTPLVMQAVDHLGLFARFKSDLPASWAERLRIWSVISERFANTPLRGAGLDASRIPGVALHPHNAPMQLWYELGLPGAVLGTLFWLWLWRRIADCSRRDRVHGATAAATATVYLVIGSVSFGLWQEWWLGVGAFATALCVLLGKMLEATTPFAHANGASAARGAARAATSTGRVQLRRSRGPRSPDSAGRTTFPGP